MMEINLAHVLMLKKQSILSSQDAATILEATYRLMENDYEKPYDENVEDLFFMIEDDLTKEIGAELVGNMHIAFSRNDMDTTMFRMLWRKKIVQWLDLISQLRTTILHLVDQHKYTVMPAHTHGQQAQPTTLAHYLLAIENNLHRDMDRGISLYSRINESPMGAAALATTGFRVDRDDICERLGFDTPMKNSYDAVSTSDFLIEVANVLTISLTTLSRFVHDLIFMATNEVDSLRLHDMHVQTSSIMPQKRNPSALEHSRAIISKALGKLQGAVIVAHSVPFGDIVDIGDDIQPTLVDGYEHTSQCLELVQEILEHATFNKQLMYERAEQGFSTVTELADLLVRNYNMSFRKSHSLVSKFVKELFRNQKTLKDGGAQQINDLAKKEYCLTLEVTEKDYVKAVNVMDFINVRTVYGGPSPQEVERQRQEAERDLTDKIEWIQVTLHKLSDYSARLKRDVELCVNQK